MQIFIVLFVADASSLLTREAENDVLKALAQIIDPDFGTDIVSCGFIKDLLVDDILGQVLLYNRMWWLP